MKMKSTKNGIKKRKENTHAKVTHSQVPGWTHLRVHQSVVVESWDLEGAPDFQL
jgi:hypothetical protein